jgi:hypothetical protein
MSEVLGKFSGPLDVRLINPDDFDGRGSWMLLEPLTYTAADGTVITVPANFTTDFMSVPPEVPGVVHLSRSRRAGTVHDFIYSKPHPVATREKADELLREMYLADLIEAGAKDDAELHLAANAVYAGVRIGGASHWD